MEADPPGVGGRKQRAGNGTPSAVSCVAKPAARLNSSSLYPNRTSDSALNKQDSLEMRDMSEGANAQSLHRRQFIREA
jgi:hypothetical protein